MNAVIEAIQCVVEKREKGHPLYPRQRGTVAVCPSREGVKGENPS